MKTKRGTYYYIELTGAYYAGTRPIMTKVEVVKEREWTEEEKATPRYRRGATNRWRRAHIPGRGHRSFSYCDGYTSVEGKKPVERVVVDAPSNHHEDVWTEDFSKAKPFRLKSKADEKAEMLSHGLKSIKAKVHFHEGDR